MRYLKKLKVADLLVIVILLVALIAAWIAIRTYVKKEADYKASLEEYEKIKSAYVIHPEDNSTNDSTADIPDDLSKTADETPAEELPINPPVIDWGGLKAENSDIIGWIEVPAVRIQYPVLQGESNDEYLHKAVNGEWRTAGSIFLDSENSPQMTDKHSIIYGHNMRNGSMFASLRNFNEQEVYDSCPYFWICTKEKALLYRIVSVHVSMTEDESFTLFPSTIRNGDFSDWMDRETGKTQIESPVPERYIERLVTLSTCTPSSDNTRQLVQGILIREIKNDSE